MTSREVYRVTMKPGGNTEKGVVKLARYIVDRWMPGNAGGVHVLATPALCQLLHPLWLRVQGEGRAMQLEVDTRSGRPVISEVRP